MPTELLIFEIDDLAGRIDTLFRSLRDDQAAMEAFGRDPTGVITQFVLRDEGPIPPAVISTGNRLLYSLLSNPKFIAWTREFEEQVKHDLNFAANADDPEAFRLALARLDKKKLYEQVLDGISQYADPELLDGLLHVSRRRDGSDARIPLTNLPSADVAVDVEVFVYAVAVAAVFVAAFAVVAIPVARVASDRPLTRSDIANLSSLLAERVKAHAVRARNAGELAPRATNNL